MQAPQNSICFIYGFPGKFSKVHPRRGNMQRPPGAVKKRYPYFFFQLTDVLGKRRLGYKQTFCRLRHLFAVTDREEIFKLFNFHDKALLSIISIQSVYHIPLGNTCFPHWNCFARLPVIQCQQIQRRSFHELEKICTMQSADGRTVRILYQ